MKQSKVIVINLSTSGSRLGGAAVAAEMHSASMASLYPVELWRMWDVNEEIQVESLKICNYKTKSTLPSFLAKLLPKQPQAPFFDSDILSDIVKLQPSIVHLQNPIPSIAFERIIKRCSELNIRVVVSTHGFFEIFNPNPKYNLYQKLAWKFFITTPFIRSLKYIDAFVSGYPEERKLLAKYEVEENKIHLVPNGVSSFFLTPPSTDECLTVWNKFNIDPKLPTLLFIGNHTWNKGIEVVMKLATGIDYPGKINIVVGGRLTNPEEQQQWEQKYPPSEKVNVTFTDYLTASEQKVLYSKSTLLLFPSVSDTLPLTITEAMASKLPVIAYNVGGISYQLDNGAGLVVDKVGDFESFKVAVEKLLNNTSLRKEMSVNSHYRRESVFCWDLASRKTIGIYEDLLRAPSVK
jgi:alpha-maltose-1-phosphate synthase